MSAPTPQTPGMAEHRSHGSLGVATREQWSYCWRGKTSTRHPRHGVRTPLSWAAGNGRDGVVKLLLGRKDANPNSLSKSGQTLLTLAAKNRHNRLLELLSYRPGIPDAPGNWIPTRFPRLYDPISWKSSTE